MKNMKKIILLSILTFSMLDTFGQNLPCSDFRDGTFYSPPSESMPIGWDVIREGNSQIETVTDDPQKLLGEDFVKTQYQIIEWIDECSYRLTYDDKKMNLTAYQKFLNDNGGTVNEITKIEDGCFFYKSTLSIGDEIQTMEGKMCTKK